jgi:hypothetical protein
MLFFTAVLNCFLTTDAHAITTSSTSLVLSASQYAVGDNGTLTATVTGTNPTGSVTFSVATLGALGVSPVSAGKAVLLVSDLPPLLGVFAVQALYSGDANNTTSTSANVTVTITKKTPSIVVSVSPNPVYQGQSLAIRAVVPGYGATGMVTFKDGATTLGSNALTPIAGGSEAKDCQLRG